MPRYTVENFQRFFKRIRLENWNSDQSAVESFWLNLCFKQSIFIVVPGVNKSKIIFYFKKSQPICSLYFIESKKERPKSFTRLITSIIKRRHKKKNKGKKNHCYQRSNKKRKKYKRLREGLSSPLYKKSSLKKFQQTERIHKSISVLSCLYYLNNSLLLNLSAIFLKKVLNSKHFFRVHCKEL